MPWCASTAHVVHVSQPLERREGVCGRVCVCVCVSVFVRVCMCVWEWVDHCLHSIAPTPHAALYVSNRGAPGPLANLQRNSEHCQKCQDRFHSVTAIVMTKSNPREPGKSCWHVLG